MEFVRDFSDLGKEDVLLAGGKGALLGEMFKSGIPVPPGFVLLSTVFQKILTDNNVHEEIRTLLQEAHSDQIDAIERISKKIHNKIIAVDIPHEVASDIWRSFKSLNAKYVAVRSSATAEDSVDAAWAGQLETYLNTTEEALIGNIKKCWASLYSPRAISYRFEKGLYEESVSVAVVVQKMVESEKSGTAFSVHPVTQESDQLVIEAGIGLGEAIVSGQITPDSYTVAKRSRTVLDKNIHPQSKALYRGHGGGNVWKTLYHNDGKPVLSDDEIVALSELVITIEKRCGFPCDIEWAFEKGRFYITQSRPITTLRRQSRSRLAHRLEWLFERFQLVGRIRFEKVTRDTTYIMQDVWAYGFSEGLEKEFGWVNSYTPVVINVMSAGVIEVWENQKATTWVANRVLKENKKDRAFLKNILSRYLQLVDEIDSLRRKKSLNKHELCELVRLSKEAVSFYIPYYYSAIDDRTPKELNEEAQRIWARDDFFSRNDVVIRNSLVSLYPEISGLEVAVLPSDISKWPGMEHIKRRWQGSFIVDGITYEDFEGYKMQHKNFIFWEERAASYSQEHLKGSIAQTGTATGYVRIIKRRQDMDNVHPGDILVSPMTTPDFLPAIRRASAIVTDEGGITSHASIIARELRKPCIIGTKVATKLLHDGDLVEVNANTGDVRILQKCQSD